MDLTLYADFIVSLTWSNDFNSVTNFSFCFTHLHFSFFNFFNSSFILVKSKNITSNVFTFCVNQTIFDFIHLIEITYLCCFNCTFHSPNLC